jgi:hypothetical protein
MIVGRGKNGHECFLEATPPTTTAGARRSLRGGAQEPNDPVVWGGKTGSKPSAIASGTGERLGERAASSNERRGEGAQLLDHGASEGTRAARGAESVSEQQDAPGRAASPAAKLGPVVAVEGGPAADGGAHLGRGPVLDSPKGQGQNEGGTAEEAASNQVGGGDGAGVTAGDAEKAPEPELDLSGGASLTDGGLHRTGEQAVADQAKRLTRWSAGDLAVGAVGGANDLDGRGLLDPGLDRDRRMQQGSGAPMHLMSELDERASPPRPWALSSPFVPVRTAQKLRLMAALLPQKRLGGASCCAMASTS